MKIVWALPEFEDPKTGAEKYYRQMLLSFLEKGNVTMARGINYVNDRNLLELLQNNINIFKILLKSGRDEIIIEESSKRNKFILSNILLPLIWKQKIIIIVNEVFYPRKKSGAANMLIDMINQLMFKLSYKIIVNSSATGQWVKQHGVEDNKIYIVYPILKYEQEKIPGKSTAYHQPINLLCVSHLRKNKGQEYLLDALARMNRNDVRLKLVGMIKEPEYFNYLIEKIDKNNLKDIVTIQGYCEADELENIYRDADIFVFPTLKEGFGMVLIEAMSFGLPIIASNVGGITDIIEDGVNGVLIEPASADAIASALTRMMTDKGYSATLGKNAFNKYQGLPLWPETFRKLNNVLGG